MRQTLEELIEKESYTVFEKFDDEFENVVEVKNVIKLLKQVRKATLIESANCLNELYNLKEDYKKINESDLITFLSKDKILKLDENSIEIQKQNGKEKS